LLTWRRRSTFSRFARWRSHLSSSLPSPGVLGSPLESSPVVEQVWSRIPAKSPGSKPQRFRLGRFWRSTGATRGAMPPSAGRSRHQRAGLPLEPLPPVHRRLADLEGLGDLFVGHVTDVECPDHSLPKIQGIRPPHRRLRPIPSLMQQIKLQGYLRKRIIRAWQVEKPRVADLAPASGHGDGEAAHPALPGDQFGGAPSTCRRPEAEDPARETAPGAVAPGSQSRLERGRARRGLQPAEPLECPSSCGRWGSAPASCRVVPPRDNHTIAEAGTFW
jgi:hypothetical protein